MLLTVVEENLTKLEPYKLVVPGKVLMDEPFHLSYTTFPLKLHVKNIFLYKMFHLLSLSVVNLKF